jgi:feruloyl esterase
MFHCRGGLGADRFDVMTPLINWVEGGDEPEQLDAARVVGGSTKFTRKLCPYPQRARYNGSGDPNDAGSFHCVAP